LSVDQCLGWAKPQEKGRLSRRVTDSGREIESREFGLVGKESRIKLRLRTSSHVRLAPVSCGSNRPMCAAQKNFYINENGSSIGIVRGRTTMDFRRRIKWTSVALVVVLAIGTPWTAGAQGQRGAVAEPYTPAANAKDLKAVLYNWMWGMGML